MVCPMCITTTLTTVVAPTVISAVAAIKIKQAHDRKQQIPIKTIQEKRESHIKLLNEKK